jgi:hypothetical protein
MVADDAEPMSMVSPLVTLSIRPEKLKSGSDAGYSSGLISVQLYTMESRNSSPINWNFIFFIFEDLFLGMRIE